MNQILKLSLFQKVPPSNIERRETDKDSGEEIEQTQIILNKRQLFSNAHVELNASHGNVSVGITDSSVNEPTKQNDKENQKKSQKN